VKSQILLFISHSPSGVGGKSGWHEDTPLFITKRIQADIEGPIDTEVDFCDAGNTIGNIAMGC
jgi:hypothetical protein